MWPQGRFPAKTPEHCCVPKLPLRSPIRRSGSGLALGTPPALALGPARSLACSPSADAAGVEVARADTAGNVRVAMRDGPVAAEDAVDDKTDTSSAEVVVASHIHVGQVCYSDSIHLQHLAQAGVRAQWDLYSHAHWHCWSLTAVAAAGRSYSHHLLGEVAVAGTDTMVCETYSPARTWQVGEEVVEVEEAGTVRTPADSCCLLSSGPPAQAAEAEAHTDHILRACRTAGNNQWRRGRKQEHSAAAEGAVDTDRIQ